MSGGGDIFGTVLNIVSFAVPVLRPIAIGYNMISSVANENPLGLAMSSFGAYNAFGGEAADAFSGGLDDWTSNATGAYDAGSVMDAASPGWADNPVFAGTEDAPFLGSEGLQEAVNSDSNAWTNMVGDTVQGFDQALSAPSLATNISTGMDSFGQANPMQGMGQVSSDSLGGASSNAFSQGSTEDLFNPEMGDVELNPQTGSTLEGMNSRWGSGTTGEGFQPQKYTYENKDFFDGKTGTGMNTPGDINPLSGEKFTQGLEMNNLPDIFKKLTTQIGGSSPIQKMSPLTLGLKGVGALDSLFQGRRAQDFMERQFNAANNWTDPNRARADEANKMWLQNYQNPKAGYDEFMTGAGREFTDQARAQAAKSGRRGAYLNSGKMNSDLASLYMKNQLSRGDALSRGFAGGQNNYAATASAAPGYASMVRNQNAPIFDFLGEASKNRGLADLWGGNE